MVDASDLKSEDSERVVRVRVPLRAPHRKIGMYKVMVKPHTVDMSFKTFFTFQFYKQDEDDIKVFRFDIIGDLSTYESFYKKYDDFEDRSMNMEMYGVHDVYTRPGDLEGFTSYEVDEDQYQELMENWKTWFVNQGFTCGSIIEVPIGKTGKEKNILKEEKERRNTVMNKLDIIRKEVFK